MERESHGHHDVINVISHEQKLSWMNKILKLNISDIHGSSYWLSSGSFFCRGPAKQRGSSSISMGLGLGKNFLFQSDILDISESIRGTSKILKQLAEIGSCLSKLWELTARLSQIFESQWDRLEPSLINATKQTSYQSWSWNIGF